VGGADRADAAPIGQAGGDVVDDGVQLRAVGLECVGGLAERQGESADLGVPNCLMAVGVVGLSTPGQGGENGVGERAAGGLAVGVVAPSSRARRRLVCAVLLVVSSRRAPSRIRSASRSPSARGVGSLSASRRSAVITDVGRAGHGHPPRLSLSLPPERLPRPWPRVLGGEKDVLV
jgi:hypothetical protein